MEIKRKYTPVGMNIELTTACPLHCPQCYCTLEGGKHIPFETAAKYIRQAKAFGIKHVELSGGETLCYPHLFELIQLAHEIGLKVNVAISGWHFDEACLGNLIQSGVTNIFVSLNGPMEEINQLTRDGYHYAISALELLQRKSFPNVYINWVMHHNNADYLPDMLELAEKYSVRAVVVLALKPTSKHELNTLPTLQQIKNVTQIIKDAKSGSVLVESCYSPLLAKVRDTKLLGNLNTGRNMGCGAGKNLLSINVDGKFSPCRHLDYFEEFETIEEYWNNSIVLNEIDALDEECSGLLCNSCRYVNNCRPCLAINSKMENKLCRANQYCTAYEE